MTHAAIYFDVQAARTGAAATPVVRRDHTVKLASSFIYGPAHHDPYGSLLNQLRDWFHDAWFSADAFGARLSSAWSCTEEAPHVPYVVAAAALQELRHAPATRMSLQASVTSPGLWRVCGV